MLETAARMMMVMIVPVRMIMSVMRMLMVVIGAVEKVRLDLNDTVEIEGVASEHFSQGDVAARGLMHLGIRVDAADARFDLAQLVGRDKIGLVEQNHVRESDLRLRLGGVFWPCARCLCGRRRGPRHGACPAGRYWHP